VSTTAESIRKKAFYQDELELYQITQLARQDAKTALAPREDWTEWESIVDFDAPTPSLFARADGRKLGYAGSLHSVWGWAGSGKSWLCTYLAAQEVAMRRDAYWFDLEGQRGSIASRFRACGLTDEQISTYLHYSNKDGAPDIERLRQAVAGSLVVFDSFTVLMNRVVPGSSSNDTDSVDMVYSTLLVPLLNAGCTVLVIDHVTKERAGGADAPIGSQRKLSMLDMGWNLVAKDGYSSLTVWKDRHAHFERGDTVAALQWAGGKPMLSEHAQDVPGATQKPRKLSAQQQIVAAVEAREKAVAEGLPPYDHHYTKMSLVSHMMESEGMAQTTAHRHVTALVDDGLLYQDEGRGMSTGKKIIRTTTRATAATAGTD
jgi:AAA domain